MTRFKAIDSEICDLLCKTPSTIERVAVERLVSLQSLEVMLVRTERRTYLLKRTDEEYDPSCLLSQYRLWPFRFTDDNKPNNKLFRLHL